MITDAQLMFSEAQALNIAVGTALSTKEYDIGPLDAGNVGITSIGEGQPLYFYWRCDTTFGSVGAATLQIELLSDAVSFGHDGNSTVHYDSGLLDASTGGTPLAAGAFAFIPLPPRSIDGLSDYERYLAVRYSVATEATDAGAITAGITADTSLLKQYASGLNFA